MVVDAEEYLSRFEWMNVVGAKINLERHVIEEADTADKIKDVGWGIVSEVKLRMEDKLRKLEKELPGSISLSSGGCNLCRECSRKKGSHAGCRIR